jgi:tetratricopeptide (TPR) repeat protein
MKIVAELLKQAEISSSRSLDETAQLLCQAAEKLDQIGKYEEAAQALSLFWPRLDEPPRTDGLGISAKATILWRVGVLTGWLGAIAKRETAQDEAKNLISQGMMLFRQANDLESALATQADLAHCYWREGALDEARALLSETLQELSTSSPSSKVQSRTLLLLAVVEQSATRYQDALNYLLEAAPLTETLDDHAFRGRYHNQVAITYRLLSGKENRTELIDRAILEYEAASFHLEQAGSLRNWAIVENNLGALFNSLNNYEESHKHFNRARRLFQQLEDNLLIAQVDETRARAFLGQRRFAEAEKVISEACATFEKVGDNALLAEALTTYGVILARQGKRAAARAQFEKAMERGELYGSVELAGLAGLALIEELGNSLKPDELQNAYLDADRLLEKSQSSDALARLRGAARGILSAGPVERGVTAPTDNAAVASSPRGNGETLEGLIQEVAVKHRKPLTFTAGALTAARQFFLKDNLAVWRSLLEQTARVASSKDTITEQAVKIVALRQTENANFVNPWENFVLRDWTRAAEHEFIEMALREAEGKISVAANLLGFDHYESLNSIIKSRHKDLLEVRTKPIPRRRSIIKVKRKKQ